MQISQVQIANIRLKDQYTNLIQHRDNLKNEFETITNSKAFKLWQKFTKLKKILLKPIRNPKKIGKFLQILISEGPQGITRKIKAVQSYQLAVVEVNNNYKEHFASFFPSQEVLLKQKKDSKSILRKIKISLILPTYNTNPQHLEECITSVLNQSYPYWELCIADDNSTDFETKTIIKKYASKDKRIRYIFAKENRHICVNSNRALKLSQGEFVGLLDHDDYLWPNALFEVASALNKDSSIDFIYSDEDKIDLDGKTHRDPFLKPDWSPHYLLSFNYITHFAVIRKSLVQKVGYFQEGLEGAQDWDLFLKISDIANTIHHIPKILYSWRISPNSTASAHHALTAKGYAFKNQKIVLKNHLKRNSISATVVETEYLGAWKINYKIKKELVSIIIPTKDNYAMLSTCINSIITKSSYKLFEIIIIDTGSKNKKVFELYNQFKEWNLPITVHNWSDTFNFSSVCNFGAKHAKGKHLLFLNDDTEVNTPGWLESMLQYSQQKNVGAVGVKLVYPNNNIQHSGIIYEEHVGFHHFRINSQSSEQTFFPFLHFTSVVKNCLAVTGACLMIKKTIFDKHLFDPKFPNDLNDVDLCVRTVKNGFYTVYNPYAVVTHNEGTTYKSNSKNIFIERIKKKQTITNKYVGENFQDPYFNQSISIIDPEILALKTFYENEIN